MFWVYKGIGCVSLTGVMVGWRLWIGFCCMAGSRGPGIEPWGVGRGVGSDPWGTPFRVLVGL